MHKMAAMIRAYLHAAQQVGVKKNPFVSLFLKRLLTKSSFPVIFTCKTAVRE